MSFTRLNFLTAALLCLSACAPQAESTPAGSEPGVAAASAAQPLAASPAQPLAALTEAPTAAPASAEIPPPFQGYWSDDCQSASSQNQLRIEAREIAFFESGGEVRAVVVRGDDIALIVDMYGEGEEWLATQTFKLMDNGQTLVDTGNVYAEDGKPMVRKRCAPRSAAGQNSD